MGDDLGQSEAAVALSRTPLAEREQPTQPAIGLAVARIAQHLWPVFRHQPGTDLDLEAGFARRHMGAHHAGQTVAVGNPKRPIAKRLGRDHQLVGMGCTA